MGWGFGPTHAPQTDQLHQLCHCPDGKLMADLIEEKAINVLGIFSWNQCNYIFFLNILFYMFSLGNNIVVGTMQYSCKQQLAGSNHFVLDRRRQLKWTKFWKFNSVLWKSETKRTLVSPSQACNISVTIQSEFKCECSFMIEICHFNLKDPRPNLVLIKSKLKKVFKIMQIKKIHHRVQQ